MKLIICRAATLIMFFLLIVNNSCHAQAQWETLPNVGLVFPGTTTRFDDIYFTSKDTGFVVSQNGYLYKTYDGGNYWYIKDSLGYDIYFRSIEFSDNGQYGIAGTLAGIVLRTTDWGETWTDISGAISDTSANPKRMCGLGHWGSTFIGIGWWGGPIAKVYRSTDNGATWQTTYMDTSLATELVDIAFTSADTCFITGGDDLSSPSSSTTEGRACVVLRSTDGGLTWAKVFSDTTLGGRIWKIQFITKQIAVGSIEPGYNPDTVAMIKSIDGGNTWHIIPIGSRYSFYVGTQGIGFVTPMKGWVGGYYSGMFETNDGGATWNTIPQGLYCNRYFKIDSNTMYNSGATIYKYSVPNEAIPQLAITPVHGVHLWPVSPNPTTGKIKIDFDIKSQENTVIEVVSMDSKRIYRVASDYLKPGHYTYYWDGTNAPAGNYIVWLGTDEVPAVQKFVVVR